MTKLTKIIENGWQLKIYHHLKRIDGDFEIRLCWKAKIVISTYKEVRAESVFEGFKTAAKCIADLEKRLHGYNSDNAQELAKKYKEAHLQTE